MIKFKKLFAILAGVLVAMPALATTYILTPVSTGKGFYSFAITDSASGMGTFTDMFSFTIPGVLDGSADAGLVNFAPINSTGNINFISALITGPGTSVPLSVSNGSVASLAQTDNSIPVFAGSSYLLSVTYFSAAKDASFTGSIATSPTPELATWAMMLAGIGAIGVSMRQRQRSKLRLAFA